MYNVWSTDGGRLSQILSGLTTATDSLQDLRYTYDDAGNMLTIKDYKDKTGSTPQTQTFTYDALNRLMTAKAEYGLNGTYAQESYTYDSMTGNLAAKVGANYEYTDDYNYGGVKPAHGVRRAHKSGGTNKTVTIRAKGTICDGRWPEMKLYVNEVLRYTTTVNTTSYTSYNVTNVPLTGADIIEVVFTNDCSGDGEDRNLYVDYIVVDGMTIQAEGGAAVIDRGAGTAAFDDVNVVDGQENIAWNGSLRFAVGSGAFAGGYDANGNMTVRVVDGMGQVLSYDAENRLVQVQDSLFIHTFTYDGDGNRVKATVAGVTTVYVGNYFEWTGSANTMKKYYYAGGERIAMKDSSGVKYLLGDHLGSTSVVANTSGVRTNEVRYKPWGEDRYSSGSSPTSYRYTGQRVESSIGLYFYGARWYDASIGRFIQADTIVANPLIPTDFDRYAYVRNSPVIFNDPSGHDLNCGVRGSHAAPEDCAEADPHDLGWIKYKPGCSMTAAGCHFDTTPLTHSGGVHNYGGDQVQELYEMMWLHTEGWWYSDGDFTFAEFVGLLIMQEGGGIYPQIEEVIATIVAQNLFVGGSNSAYCPGSICYNGAFNYFAASSGSVWKLLDAFVLGHNPISGYGGPQNRYYWGTDPAALMDRAAVLGNMALHPKTLNMSVDDAPTNYGNSEPWRDLLRDQEIPEGVVGDTSPTGIYFYFDIAIYYTISQYEYWYSILYP